MADEDLVLGVTEAGATRDSRQLITRLMDAFMRAHEPSCYGEDSQWKTIRAMQESVVAAIREGDIDKVASFLTRPHEGYLHYGFEDLGVWSIEAYRDVNRRTGYAAHCQEVLRQIARAMGVLAVPNPESQSPAPEVPGISSLLDGVERELGISIRPPEPYPFYYGLRTDRGVIGERVLNAVYCAWRIRQLTRSVARPRILEIGAGVGRLADYCYRLGLTDYWIVDIPLTSLVHGHFLAHALGEDHVVLDGETGAERPDAVKILNPDRFFADSSLQFDLVVNSDSMTEFGRDMATRYLRRVAERSALFFSVNHEANEFRVCDLCRESGTFESAQRSPYWPRPGYVEEVFTRPRVQAKTTGWFRSRRS
jgi:hypothetical protein